MTRFVLCGTGWRAGFYMRIAALLKDEFEIAAIYTRREEKRDELTASGYKASADLAEALSFRHDAVIAAGGPEGFLPLLMELGRRGETILAETTFLSLDEDGLKKASLIPGYTMEQYWHTPLYSSIREALPLIGKIDSVYLSALHNHHAASIMRGIFPHLKIKEIRRLLEKESGCLKTGSRAGLERKGEKECYKRKITAVEFGSGEIFITDFSSNQYHSYIIPSRIEIRGEMGVITEKGVAYVDNDGWPVSLPFVFQREETKPNQHPVLTHVTLGERVVFTNPFYPDALSDDEIAIAMMLREASEKRLEYTIRDGVEDARIGKMF